MDWLTVSAPEDYNAALPSGIRTENIDSWTASHIHRRGLEMLISYAHQAQDRNFARAYGPVCPPHGQTWPNGWRIEVLRRPLAKNLVGMQIGTLPKIKPVQASAIKSTLRAGLVLDSYRLPPVMLPPPFEVEGISGWWKTDTGATFEIGMDADSIIPGNENGALLVADGWRIYTPSSPSAIDFMVQDARVGWDRNGRYWTMPRATSQSDIHHVLWGAAYRMRRDGVAMGNQRRDAEHFAEWAAGLRGAQRQGARNRFGYDHMAIAVSKIGK